MLNLIHQHAIYGRRVRTLARMVASHLSEGARVLDVGCGDGLVDSLIVARRPDLSIEGIDVLVRPNAHIPVTGFDGTTIPFEDESFDSVCFVDVLHHTPDPAALLREAARVARRCIVVKDHRLDGFLAGPTLRFMDWVGNARHGVSLPYNYWPEDRWRSTFAELGLTLREWDDRVPLYAFPLNFAFGRRLHFVSRLEH